MRSADGLSEIDLRNTRYYTFHHLTISMASKSATNTPARLDDLVLRPSERVLQYLQQEFDRPGLANGARLPSNRELARRLGVSIPTVQSVLKRLSNSGRVLVRHGSGTYLLSKSREGGEPLRVAIASLLHPGEQLNDPWLEAIVSGFMPVALKSHPTTFVGIAPEKFGQDESVAALLSELPKADGLIILPYALMPKDRDFVAGEYERAGKPVVYLNPPEVNATQNFVATDYLGPAVRLGRAWRQSGRKRVVLYTVLQPYEYAVSAQLRLMGLVCGIGDALGNSVSLQVLQPGESGSEAAYQTMKKILRGPEPPDAMLVAMHGAVAGIRRALEEAGLKVPADVSLVSIAKQNDTPRKADLASETLIHEPTAPLSVGLLEMLFDRIKHDGASRPGKYTSATLVGNLSTRPVENSLLGL